MPKPLNLTLVKSYGHGLALRVIALFSKLVFLFYVVPNLDDGLYSRYLYIFTIALIIARIFSLGAEEHLPTIIRNNTSEIGRFFPLFLISYCFSIIALVMFLIKYNEIILLVSLIAQLASGWVVGGLSRSINPLYYERLLNIPVIIFVLWCVINPPSNIGALIIAYSFSALLIQTWIAISIRPKKIYLSKSFLRTIPKLLSVMVPGIYKTTSNILVVLNTRAAVVIPAIILAFTVDDRIAIAISVGEAAFQLGMVIVMRHYAAFCRHEKSYQFMIKTCAILFGFTASIGLLILLAPIPVQINKIDWVLVGWALIFNASLLVFMEARYYYWALNKGAIIANLVQIAYFILQFAAVIILPSEWWFVTMCFTAAIFAVIYLAVTFMKLLPDPSDIDAV